MIWNPSTLDPPSREVQRLVAERRFTSILDAGCGWGRNLAPFVGAGSVVHGFDLDKEAVDKARAHLGSSETIRIWHDDVRTASVAQSYELVMCLGVLHFLSREDRVNCYQRLRDWLAPDGYMMIVMFNSKTPIPHDLAPIMVDVPSDSGELVGAFSDWHTISHESYVYDDTHDGGRVRHTHSIDRLIVRRAT